MSRKRFSVEQIINHLREAEVLPSQGQTVGEICRRIGVSEQSYYRWRREFGGLNAPYRHPSQAGSGLFDNAAAVHASIRNHFN